MVGCGLAKINVKIDKERLSGLLGRKGAHWHWEPEINRSHFHLIYLTRKPKGIEVFKDAERQAMRDMESARAKAQQSRRQQKRGGQKELFSAEELHDPTYFDEIRDRY